MPIKLLPTYRLPLIVMTQGDDSFNEMFEPVITFVYALKRELASFAVLPNNCILAGRRLVSMPSPHVEQTHPDLEEKIGEARWCNRPGSRTSQKRDVRQESRGIIQPEAAFEARVAPAVANGNCAPRRGHIHRAQPGSPRPGEVSRKRSRS